METIIGSCIAALATLGAAVILRPKTPSEPVVAGLVDLEAPSLFRRFQDWADRKWELLYVALSCFCVCALAYELEAVEENLEHLSDGAEAVGLLGSAITATVLRGAVVLIEASSFLAYMLVLVRWIRRSRGEA